MSRAPTLIALIALVGGCAWTEIPIHSSPQVAVTEADAPAPTPEETAATEAWPAMPEPGPLPDFQVPQAQRFELANGLPVTLVRAGKVPLASVRLYSRVGASSDPPGKAGLAALTLDLLDEGAGDRDASELSAALQDLAADVSVSATLDHSAAVLFSLEDKLPQTLPLLADIVRRPSFTPADFERVRKQQANRLLAARDRLPSVAQRVFRRELFGDGYLGNPSSGWPESVAAIELADVQAWYVGAFHPRHLGLVVTSRLAAEELKPLLDEQFGDWQGEGEPLTVPQTLASPRPLEGVEIRWVDRPGVAQSYVLVGRAAEAWTPEGSAPGLVADRIIGGAFTSRLNMNLREDKGYTYGAYTGLQRRLRGGLVYARASVKTDVTAAALTEILRELRDAVGDRPFTEAEHADAVGAMQQEEPARYERVASINARFGVAEALGRPADWLAGYAERVRAVDLAGAQAYADSLLGGPGFLVVIVGDRVAAGPAVEALELGPIVALDDEGRPLPEGENR